MQFVDSVKAADDLTVDVKFKIPAPRFKFEVLTEKFDTGIPIVPAALGIEAGRLHHRARRHRDPALRPLRPRRLERQPEDLQPARRLVGDQGRPHAEPAVKRIVMVNLGGQVGQNMDTVAQRLVNNEMDSALDMRSAVIGNILAQNTKITTHAGNKSPFGYLDWWPNSLWMNTQLAPYNDARVRRAISLVINRDQINDVIYEGAKIATIYPFPLYPGLQAFADSPDVKALEEKYQPGKFDPDESAKLMTEAGFKKNGDGLWEKDGKTVNATIQGFDGIHSDIGPVLVEMLRQGGFDASVNFGTDAYQNMVDGVPGLYLFGHGASLKDPYAAFELFHGRYSASIGTSAGNNRFSRYKNPDYDAILDQMAPLSSDDPKFHGLAVKALEIYWKRADRRSDHPVAPSHRLQPDLLDQLANRSQPRHGHQRSLLGSDGPPRGDEPEAGPVG